MILEGIITTTNVDGSVNIAPMGPTVDDALRPVVLRPYQSSKTFANLERTSTAVFHVTDDVELLAQAAVGEVMPVPRLERVDEIDGWRLADCCRWYALRVRSIDAGEARTHCQAEVVLAGKVRDFFGFNRGKNAVVEAAILATRLHLLVRTEILAEFERLRILVEKTGGRAEHRALDFLEAYIRSAP